MAWNGMETCPSLKVSGMLPKVDHAGTLTNVTDESDTGRMVSVRPS